MAEFDAQESWLSCMLHLAALEVIICEDEVKFFCSHSRALAPLSMARSMIYIGTQLHLLLIGVSMMIGQDEDEDNSSINCNIDGCSFCCCEGMWLHTPKMVYSKHSHNA